MKTQKLLSIIVIVLFLASTAFSKIWTVDNKSGSVADFSEIQAAHNAAVNGDTIYVHSSGSTIYSSEMKQGYYDVKWDASGFASGLYFYRLRSESFVSVKKMFLLQ